MAVHVNNLLQQILRTPLDADSIHFGTRLPADLADKLPFVHARHVAGSEMHPELADWAAVVIDSYAATDTQAFAAAHAAVDLLKAAFRNHTQYGAGYISFIDKDSAVPPFPAPRSAGPDDQFRYTAEQRLLLRHPLA